MAQDDNNDSKVEINKHIIGGGTHTSDNDYSDKRSQNEPVRDTIPPPPPQTQEKK